MPFVSPTPHLAFPALLPFLKNAHPQQNTPRPAGRSIIACQRMMDRLKGTLKNELEALKSGQPIDESTPKKSPAKTPRKRKPKGDADDATPAKRGRKKKSEAEVPEDADDEEVLGVKAEPVDDDLDIETEI
jgi:hypothetical protein